MHREAGDSPAQGLVALRGGCDCWWHYCHVSVSKPWVQSHSIFTPMRDRFMLQRMPGVAEGRGEIGMQDGKQRVLGPRARGLPLLSTVLESLDKSLPRRASVCSVLLDRIMVSVCLLLRSLK